MNTILKVKVKQDAERRDKSQLAALYAEFAEEDRALAEMGMADYAAGLVREDTADAVEEPPANARL